jgi:hypothetical protein
MSIPHESHVLGGKPDLLPRREQTSTLANVDFDPHRYVYPQPDVAEIIGDTVIGVGNYVSPSKMVTQMCVL